MKTPSPLLNAARKTEAAIEILCKSVLTLTGFGLLAVLVVNVFVRYVMQGSVEAASELPALMFPWFVMGGVVLAAVRGNHVAMQLTMHMLPPAGRRVLATFIQGLSAVVFANLAWHSVENTLVAHDELSTILHVPGSVGYAALTVALALLALCAVTAFVRFGILAEPVMVDMAAAEGAVV
ncbi:MAG: TRAP transporter small permease subunit [Rhodoferax sp.]|uniref:TRAP transporter small permease n=1 Tax=Rhodoferax sp. TaxID=50421 RepID=UPI00261FBD56|nr:TRAP transporter small permease subunit [Rhodoferax sp.]MDD2880845.1 TRAP transporter small permease subunit [Rhodoferax sp.]